MDKYIQPLALSLSLSLITGATLSFGCLAAPNKQEEKSPGQKSSSEAKLSGTHSEPEQEKPTQAALARHRIASMLRSGTELCDMQGANGGSDSYDSENLDILAKAMPALRVKAAQALPEPREALVRRFALEAVSISDRLGDCEGGDQYARLVSEMADLSEMQNIPAIFNELQATGRQRESSLLKRSIMGPAPMWVPRLQAQGENEKETVANLSESNHLTRNCLAAIAKKDKQAAKQLAENILSAYKNTTSRSKTQNQSYWASKPQNLYCTILHIARRFSDLGWYTESNHLLKALNASDQENPDWPGINSFLLVELTVNAERAKNDSDKLWQRLDRESGFATRFKHNTKEGSGENSKEKPRIVTYDYSTSEKLRRFASAYYCAGELDRAAILIEQALHQYTNIDPKASADYHIIHCHDDGISGDHVLLLLDAAIINSRQKKLDQAANFLSEALSGTAITEAGYGPKLAELASIYTENNKRDEAIAFLKKARAKNILPNYMAPRSSTSSPYVVDYCLARLLFESGQISDARTIIESAIEQAVTPVQPSEPRKRIPALPKDDYAYAPSILAGDCAFEQGDFKAAALRYEQAGLSRRFSTLPISRSTSLSSHWLQKAIDCADKCAKFLPEEYARLYTELATSIKDSSPQKAFALDKKAVELMSDNDPKKPAILSEMASLSQQIRYQTAAPEQRTSSHAEPNEPGKTLPSAQIPPTTDAADQQIPLLRRAAQAAQICGDKTLSSRYMQLAIAEAAANQLDSAIEDCQRSLNAYTGASPAGNWWSPALLPANNQITNFLASKDRNADSVKLFNLAIERVKSVNGPDSPETLQQILELLHFYIQRKDNQNALATLDRALACKMRPKSWRDNWARMPHSYRGPNFAVAFDWARSLAPSDPKLALNTMERILKAQERQLPPDDLQIADTLVANANVENILKDNAQALSSYQKAFAIFKLYYGEKAALLRLSVDYPALLRQSGKAGEADRLEALNNPPAQKTAASPAASPAEDRAGGPAANPANGPAANLANGPAAGPAPKSTPKSTPKSAPVAPTDRLAALKPKEVDLATLKSDYEKAAAEAPYSLLTMTALKELAWAARSKQDRDLAIDCIKKQIALADRFGDSPQEKAGYYKTLVDISLEKDNLDEAKSWLGKLLAVGGLTAMEQASCQQKLLKAYIDAKQPHEASIYIQTLWNSNGIDGPQLEQSQRELIQFLIKENRNDEAKQEVHSLFEQRAKWIPAQRYFYEAILLGKIAVQTGETTYLRELLLKGETLLPGDQGQFYLRDFADLWEKAGDNAHAEALRSKFKTFLASITPNQGFPQAFNPPRRGISFVQTGKGLEFPAPTRPERNYVFNFAALASNSLRLEDDSYLTLDQTSSAIALAGSYGELKAGQKANFSGKLTFIYGTYPTNHLDIAPPPKPRPGWGGNGGGGGFGGTLMMGLPAAWAPPFKPPFLPPPNCKTLDAATQKNANLVLKPGSYSVDRLDLDSLSSEPPGRVRLFLSSSASSGGLPVFHARPNAKINLLNLDTATRLPRLEIWYGGTGTIKLDKGSNFNGIIYAPDARVEVGPGQATFVGSIVARDIVFTGESRLCWDPLLSNWTEY